jgi:V/A-type H+-transporting ATPase subunit F
VKLAAICDKDTAVGLRLAGIHELFIPEKPLRALDEIKKRKDIGVLFITEEIAELLGKELTEFRLRYELPLIVEIPDKKGRLEKHLDFVSHLTKRAVGIDIKRGK